MGFCAPAWSADLTVSVKTLAGRPVRDAVVSVYPDGGAAGAARQSGPFRVVQQNLQFDPFVLVVPAGAEVPFPNRDTVPHHVYSFSAANKFELRLYGKDETRTVKFDKAGVVALGCNIHDQMVGFVKVVDTPFTAKTGDNGEAVVHGLPSGGATVRIWHPYAKVAKNEIERRMTLPRDVPLREAIAFDLRNPPERRGGY